MSPWVSSSGTSEAYSNTQSISWSGPAMKPSSDIVVLTRTIPMRTPYGWAVPPASCSPAAPGPTESGLYGLRLCLDGALGNRLALDVALAHQPQRQQRARERQRGAQDEDRVQAVQEPLLGRVADGALRPLGNSLERLPEAPGGCRLDQPAGLPAADRAAGDLL